MEIAAPRISKIKFDINVNLLRPLASECVGWRSYELPLPNECKQQSKRAEADDNPD
jgi:hypothetical protein